MQTLSRMCKNSNLLEFKGLFTIFDKKNTTSTQKSDHRGMTLVKWRSGLDDVSSTVEIMKELLDDIQVTFDTGDTTVVDLI